MAVSASKQHFCTTRTGSHLLVVRREGGREGGIVGVEGERERERRREGESDRIMNGGEGRTWLLKIEWGNPRKATNNFETRLVIYRRKVDEM